MEDTLGDGDRRRETTHFSHSLTVLVHLVYRLELEVENNLKMVFSIKHNDHYWYSAIVLE